MSKEPNPQKPNNQEGDNQNSLRNKNNSSGGQKPKKTDNTPRVGRTFFNNVTGIILILVAIIGLYTYLDPGTTTPTISVSELAADISNGKVGTINITDDDLAITYTDQTKKVSKKESQSSLTETLSNLGVEKAKLASVKIENTVDKGFGYWAGNILPFAFPVILFFFMIWFLTRQAKGAGMQAMSFGQSRARLTLPEDTKVKITFKDVAGAKEAKAELAEIVDFLKNPKKFLDIGARIPKGILLMGAPGTGKCVTGDTRIVTNKGVLRIDEIPKYFNVEADDAVNGLSVTSLNPSTTAFEKADVSHWYNLGTQPTKVLQTELGVSVEGTHEHPVVVIDSATGDFIFKRLDSVKEGEWVVAGYGNALFGNHTSIPHSDVAYMLGVLTGDGCMTIKNRTCLSTADSEVLSKIQQISEKYLKSVFVKKSSGKYDYELSSKEAKSMLCEWGLQEVYAEHKKVPEWIKIGPKEHVTAFLRGLFDTDGSVEKKGAVSFSTSSKELVTDVHNLLLNLGVVARLNSRKKLYNGKMQFYITIYGDFVEMFRKEIGFTIIRKQKRLEEVCHKQRNTNVNLIPHQQEKIKSVWLSALETTTLITDRSFYKQAVYKNIRRYINGDRTPSLEGMVTVLDAVSDMIQPVMETEEARHLRKIASGKFFFTKVTTIKNSSACVFDITVPRLHNFIGNGLINHNTLLARAVAGEAGVAFFSMSGSEFVEMFVGVGASRVRDLFKLAKQAAPAIIFIDEIDAVGRVRGTGVGGGNDEREQTLNQILVEMDGFEPTEKVIVMAATNRPDVLDPALLRPGRFDRRVTIDLPDRADRLAILEVHAKNKPFAEDVNLDVIAERTPGFSGADLHSLMNEGAIIAARENRTTIGQFDLIRSIEKVMLGPERKSHLLSKKEKELTAYHEAGHAILASVLTHADPVHKVSIISRGRAAGYTLKLPLEERRLQSKNEFLDDIVVSLGGYVVEKNIFNDLTTGSSNDLQVATSLARDMVTKYGMSDTIGPVALEAGSGRAMFGNNVGERDYSETVGTTIDGEVSKIMNDAYARAFELITLHRPALDAISKALVAAETLERAEFEQILVAHGITPKKKDRIETEVEV